MGWTCGVQALDQDKILKVGVETGDDCTSLQKSHVGLTADRPKIVAKAFNTLAGRIIQITDRPIISSGVDHDAQGACSATHRALGWGYPTDLTMNEAGFIRSACPLAGAS